MVLIFILLLFEKVAGDNVLTGPKVVKQCAGRTVHVTCRYHSFYRDNVKYWCKGYYFNFCTTLIRTDQSAPGNGPLDIADHKKEGFFTVRMRGAKPGDNGWYWCAIERVSRHVSISMELSVSSEAQHCSVPEPTTQCNVRETTTLPLTTSQITTAKTSKTTWTSQAASSVTDSTYVKPESMTTEVLFPESPVYTIWSVMRWILFVGLCSYLLCFTIYFELRRRRD
ncbi:CMRF35-like molecule 7 [Salminus brasiliensis]|uniref:CMRF35-like molecule 7 n=1 Tax=Salminus brasiliensis TaxID=930266 RepID=UPI003B830821